MIIEDKDILQADATVIAGILILLTIMHLNPIILKERQEIEIEYLVFAFAFGKPFCNSVIPPC